MSEEFYIEFEGVGASDANVLAAGLRDFLLDEASNNGVNVDVSISKSNPNNMDLGSTLVLIFGTPAAIAVAHGVSKWLAMRNSGGITLQDKDGKLIAKNITSSDALKLADKFFKKND